jgi:AcrR family transcriptional regulator
MTDIELRKPGRPRSAQADRAILRATLELVAQDGIQGMSLEAVAARAGVSKTTIYRRWPNKDALILDALRQSKPPPLTFDTGNFRVDIEHYLRSLRALLADPLMQRLSLRLLGELSGRPEWSEGYFSDTMRPNLVALAGMIERARTRGELRADANTTLVMEILGGPLFYHFIFSLFMPNQPEFDIEQFIALVWDGLKPFRPEDHREASRSNAGANPIGE